MNFPAPDLDAAHDQGPGRPRSRPFDVAGPAIEPIELEGGQPRPRSDRDCASWTDPTMIAPGVFYPTGADTAEERLQLLRQPVPAGRGRRDLLRPAIGQDRGALAGADAARFHVRHQGPRADDRPADRDEAAAEGIRTALPPELAAKVAASTAATCRPTCGTRSGGSSATAWSPCGRGGQLGSILLQYPRWFFPSSENRAAILEARERLGGLVSSVEFRHGSWFNEKNLERTIRFLTDHAIHARSWSTARRGFKSSAAGRCSPRPRRTSRSSASTAGGPRRGKRRTSRPSSDSAGSTTARSSPNGCRGSGTSRTRSARRTSS